MTHKYPDLFKNFDEQIEAALQRHKDYVRCYPSLSHLEVKDNRIHLIFKNEMVLNFPISLLKQEIRNLKDLEEYWLSEDGLSVHWPKLGLDYSISGFLHGIFS